MILINQNPNAEPSAARWSWVASGLLVLAGISLLASLLFPIWRITLEAPQYPEGLGMRIWAKTIAGENPDDLNIINELNHYIGMKKIVPSSIPELEYIFPIILVFGLACFAAAWRPRVWSSAALLAALTAMGGYGLYDFWQWEYDYGHNLNPMAAIKVPGMSYQPPLIGEAKLLNFLSTSWPAAGGCLLFLGGALIALALAASILRNTGWPRRLVAANPRRPGTRAGKLTDKHGGIGSGAALSALLLLGLTLSACEKPGPTPFLWGEDACYFCKMTLVEKGYAVERINAKGKIFKYDAIECLLEELKVHPLGPGERIFVSDRSRPDAELTEATGNFFLQGGKITSPMGRALAAFQSQDSALAFQTRGGGLLLHWDGLQKI